MVLPTAYFGPVWYYSLLNSGREISVELFENYQKQTIRNRCEIATSQGRQVLTVPIESKHGQKTLIKDVRISNHGNWRHIHWMALTTAYGDSPFFEYYQDDIYPFFEKQWDYLLDYNNAINETVCSLLDISPVLNTTQQYQGICDEACEPLNFKEYYQVYKSRMGFIPHLSILDLLFNVGNESVFYL